MIRSVSTFGLPRCGRQAQILVASHIRNPFVGIRCLGELPHHFQPIEGGMSKEERQKQLKKFKRYQSLAHVRGEDLAKIMASPDRLYEAPELPFPDVEPPVPNAITSGYRREDFLLDFDNWTNLNHGGYGAALRVGLNRANGWRRYLEMEPSRYFEHDLLPHLAWSTRLLADFMHAPSKRELTIVPNVTSGFNAVVAGHAKHYGAGNVHAVIWDTTYGAVKKMAEFYYGKENVSEISFQGEYLDKVAATTTDPENVFIEAVQDHMDRNKEKMAGKKLLFCIDHVSSNTALTFPIIELTKYIKRNYNYNDWDDAIVAVDGAHALLTRHINLDELFDHAGIDFYLSSGHKWLSAPRGVGIMAADYRWHNTIIRAPPIVTEGVDQKDLMSRFVWDGTRDYAAALSIPAVIDYWYKRNPKGLTVLRYDLRRRLKEGIKILAEYWHPSDFDDETTWPGRITLARIDAMILAPMALVALPEAMFGSGQTSTDAKFVQDYLYTRNIEVPIKCINEKLYARISCHVYNTPEDFEKLANSILRLTELVME